VIIKCIDFVHFVVGFVLRRIHTASVDATLTTTTC